MRSLKAQARMSKSETNPKLKINNGAADNGFVVQRSKSVVSRVLQSRSACSLWAFFRLMRTLPTLKSALQQVWKLALQVWLACVTKFRFLVWCKFSSLRLVFVQDTELMGSLRKSKST